MRARILPLALLLVVAGAVIVPASAVFASPRHHIVLAQDEGTDTEQSGNDKGGEGQKDPAAETGADKEAPVEEEVGPPWTYQMARLSIGLVLLLGAGMALLYRRMIGARQKTRP
jgi:hypothetical protein